MEEKPINKVVTLSANVEFFRTKKLKASAPVPNDKKRLAAIRQAWRPQDGPTKYIESEVSAEAAEKIKMAKLRAAWRPLSGPLAA